MRPGAFFALSAHFHPRPPRRQTVTSPPTPEENAKRLSPAGVSGVRDPVRSGRGPGGHSSAIAALPYRPAPSAPPPAGVRKATFT